LAHYLKSKNIEEVHLSYFGSDSPTRYGIQYKWLLSKGLKNPNPEGRMDLSQKPVIAISVTNLQGVYFPNHDMYASLKHHTPVKKIGYSIFVYDFRGKKQKAKMNDGNG